MSHTTNGSAHLQEPALRYARQDFPIIRDSVTVGEALNIIRREGVGERIIYFYIINDEGQLAGIIPTRRLLTATPQRTIADVMITDVITISDRATVQDACEMFVKHKFFAFPIVDDLNHMRGVIDIGFFSEETINVTHAELVISTSPDQILKRTDNERLLKKIRQLCPQAKAIVTADSSQKALELYNRGADFVFIPRIHSSAQVAQIIESGLREGLDNERAEQIAHLKIRDEVLV